MYIVRIAMLAQNAGESVYKYKKAWLSRGRNCKDGNFERKKMEAPGRDFDMCRDGLVRRHVVMVVVVVA